MNFEAIGTQWTISSSQDLSHLTQKVLDRIETFDSFYSRFKPTSFVSHTVQQTGTYKLPSDAKLLLDFYKTLYKLSNGLVTPLIGKTMEQAGYDAEYSFKVAPLSSPPTWDKALDYKFPHLTIKQPVVLDFGAAGKGYLIDIIGALLKEHTIRDYCINAGGDILVVGQKQRIGLENPDNFEQAIGVTELTNGALCGSAGNRRKWGKFHHTINPKTLESPTGIKAIWVKAQSAMIADGLATALYFTNPDDLRKHFDFEYAMIVGNELTASAGFNAEFFGEEA